MFQIIVEHDSKSIHILDFDMVYCFAYSFLSFEVKAFPILFHCISCIVRLTFYCHFFQALALQVVGVFPKHVGKKLLRTFSILIFLRLVLTT